jgi:hypothetical protein
MVDDMDMVVFRDEKAKLNKINQRFVINLNENRCAEPGD